MAQECDQPLLIKVHFCMFLMRIGWLVYLMERSPTPSLPSALLPKLYTYPSVVRNNECSSPHETYFILNGNFKCLGIFCYLRELTPICP